MADLVTTAKNAREHLARALAALQSDPSVLSQFVVVAEPVSRAIGALFQIERSQGAALGESAPVALEAIRRSLAILQQQSAAPPAVESALEAVAGALGLVHEITAHATVPRTIPDDPPPIEAQPPAAFAPTVVAEPAPVIMRSAPPAAAAVPAPGVAPVAGAAASGHPFAPAAQTLPDLEPLRFPSREAVAPAAVAPAPAAVAPAPAAVAPAPAAVAPAPAAVAPAPAAVAQQSAFPMPSIRIDAELGAHSPSNFFKGLSGNDVIEHGGLFVATYKVPPIGQDIALHVSLPGGYEFDAVGVVRWTRDPGDGGQPGFGAQLIRLTPEARQLVYRYVRNREPLFHDDL